jgi:3-dehydroquinate dehydratase/shikimate dehydrogenase
MENTPNGTSLCATVTAATTADLLRARDEASGHGDLVELRLDGVRDVSVRAVLAERPCPVVATCRPTWEGGRFDGTEEERERVLKEAIAGGAEWVDVEWRAPGRERLLAAAGERAVLSLHDFAGAPQNIESLARAMMAATRGLVKIAVKATRLRDLLPLMDIGRHLGASGRLILIGMGEAGVVSRILAARFGSRWSYAGEGVAPGQMPARRLIDEFRFREISRETPVYGIVGRPVGHSLSPAIHNAAFRAGGVAAVYVPLEAQDFADFTSVARPLGVEGVSVTAPFKRDALEAAAVVSPEARRVGAVNTLRRSEAGTWEGDNTDVAGFLAPLAGAKLEGRRAMILGTGGGARAVAAGLASRGATVTVCGRRLDRARDVAAVAGGLALPWPPPPGSWDLLVNATPVGTWPHTDASPMRGLPLEGDLVYDLVYNPEMTALIADAQASGCRTIGGLDMLVAQAVAQWSWWTGRAAPADAMLEAARRRLVAMKTERVGE